MTTADRPDRISVGIRGRIDGYASGTGKALSRHVDHHGCSSRIEQLARDCFERVQEDDEWVEKKARGAAR